MLGEKPWEPVEREQPAEGLDPDPHDRHGHDRRDHRQPAADPAHRPHGETRETGEVEHEQRVTGESRSRQPSG
jgi:hypothetical protein